MTGERIAEPPRLNLEKSVTLFKLLCEGTPGDIQNADIGFEFQIKTHGGDCGCNRDLEYQWHDKFDMEEVLRVGTCLCNNNTAMETSSEFDEDCFYPSANCCASFFPLHVATGSNKPLMVKWLIDRGADVNCRTAAWQMTPLHICATHGHVDCARVLLEAGADLNILNKSLHTASSWAVFNKQLGVLQVLLEKFCAQDPVGNSPGPKDLVHMCLDLFMTDSFEEALQMVIKAGINVNVQTNGRTPLLRAIEENSLRGVELLLQSPTIDVNVAGFHGQITPLCAAIEMSHANIKIISMLLEAGADPNLCSEGDNTPVMIASVENKPDVVKLLIDHGGDVNLVNNMGYQALHWAAWDNHVGVMKELLSAGAKPDCQTSDKNTPLSLATHGDAMAAFNLLLPLGCNVNNKDKDLDTALHYAAYNGNLEMVQSLIKHGADPEMLNNVAATPLWNAVYQNHWNVFQYLLKLNVPLDVPSRGIDQHAQSSDVVYIYPQPVTPFYVALETGFFPMAQCLAVAGYNITKEYCIQTGDVPDALLHSPEMMNWLDQAICEPPSLMSLCRYQIRQGLGREVKEKVQQLEIPVELKHHLLLTDLTSIQLDSPFTLLKL
ncbi:ankyrin-3 [Lingula anatina]|uniref:Ankyrin-3 n=1 Tax=Lingula anatina TaxID=7574 RepID=A0A1S3JSD8_LINAN|nr:ankyrin-3 [Lingula anatina]|eukprot:XP_013413021.1 ankyrin-3 [Lingula anatina]